MALQEAEVVQCPHCGASNPVIEELCRHCGQPLAIVIGPPASMFRRVRLGTIMLLVAVVAVCLALTRPVPALGVLLIAWFVPSILRTIAIIETRKQDGLPVERRHWFAGSFSSLGLVLLSGILLGASTLVLAVLCIGTIGGMTGSFELVLLLSVSVGVGTYLILRRLWYRVW